MQPVTASALSAKPNMTRLLQKLVCSTPLKLTVNGSCMAPVIEDGVAVTIKSKTFYWPGDILAVHYDRTLIVVHRLLLPLPSLRRWKLLTKADNAFTVDALTSSGQVIGAITAPSLVSTRDRTSALATGLRFLLACSLRRLTASAGFHPSPSSS